LKKSSWTSMAALDAGAPSAAVLAIGNLLDQASNERDKLSQSSRAYSSMLFNNILGSTNALVVDLHMNTSPPDSSMITPPRCATVHFLAAQNASRRQLT
jgi:hypothetical protein